MIWGNFEILTHHLEQREQAIEDGAVCFRIQVVMQSGLMVASRPRRVKLRKSRIILPVGLPNASCHVR
jgi:hypothetical protein